MNPGPRRRARFIRGASYVFSRLQPLVRPGRQVRTEAWSNQARGGSFIKRTCPSEQTENRLDRDSTRGQAHSRSFQRRPAAKGGKRKRLLEISTEPQRTSPGTGPETDAASAWYVFGCAIFLLYVHLACTRRSSLPFGLFAEMDGRRKQRNGLCVNANELFLNFSSKSTALAQILRCLCGSARAPRRKPS